MRCSVGFLMFPEVEELDFVGPWEVISIWKQHFNGPETIITVSQNGGLITCAKRLQIMSSYSFSNCPQLDYLFVPGGWGTRAEVNNETLTSFIQEKAKHCNKVLSVCTGAFLLQAAGLLDGKQATTHWHSLDRLKAFERTTVVTKRIVQDGNIWTSAGISAGIDLALALVAEVAGKETADKIQHHMEYYPANNH